MSCLTEDENKLRPPVELEISCEGFARFTKLGRPRAGPFALLLTNVCNAAPVSDVTSAYQFRRHDAARIKRNLSARVPRHIVGRDDRPIPLAPQAGQATHVAGKRRRIGTHPLVYMNSSIDGGPLSTAR